ncbi:MAG: hypothetical protein F6K54_02950 [Okeania sp. SIO3B5]|uniref:hypothetical protein n=1 Tax=Okeania sp. SIO3B5 TaxID=2607811 RepID=UPI00140102B9|nr:hypothetical protein [Okeania sp. SIO3B5]NEO52132.1 hypothetical protein [Okeania sp. SIO3B5]
MNKIKWRTILGLILVWVGTILNWEWMWGILFLIWVISDFFTGVTYFIEPITKKDNPLLYWLIMISWVALSVLSIATIFN